MRDSFRGTNITIFALFFLMSLLEALGSQNWIVAGLWLAFGALFLRADLSRPRERRGADRSPRR